MNDDKIAKCLICGEPMPAGEEMFKFHGLSGDCPKPPLPIQQKKQMLRGLLWAVARADERVVTMLFDNPEQANTFVAGIKVDESIFKGE